MKQLLSIALVTGMIFSFGAAQAQTTWTDEFAHLSQLGQNKIQADLFYDYRTNVAAYPAWQAWLLENKPPMLVVWASTILLSPSAAQRPTSEIYLRRKFISWKPDTSRWMKRSMRSPHSFAAFSITRKLQALEHPYNFHKGVLIMTLGLGFKLSFAIGVVTMTALAFGSDKSDSASQIRYKTQRVDDLNIFYREAGLSSRPAIVLLHGFPSSSHMYRDLIPKLAVSYHVVAADMPGFGYTDQPSVDKFEYTFDHLASVMDHFLDSIGVTRYSMYIQDYGSPVGFRLFLKHPERIQSIITQNGNAYEEGLSPFWAESIAPYWKEKNPDTERKIRGLLTFDTTKFQYTQGFRNPEHVSPDSYTFDQMTLDRPGNAEIQLALFYDYQNNLKQYPQWHQTLRKAHPPVLAVWGKNDPIFLPAGAEAFKKDVPNVEIHFVDSGHFALEEDADAIAGYILGFLAKHVR